MFRDILKVKEKIFRLTKRRYVKPRWSHVECRNTGGYVEIFTERCATPYASVRSHTWDVHKSQLHPIHEIHCNFQVTVSFT